MVFLFYSVFCFAAPVMLELPVVLGDIGHVVPNECYPYDAYSIYTYRIPEIYLSVGTERGFVGAALSRAKRLIFVDIGTDVVLFNRINAKLLKAATRSAYVYLRLSASFDEWNKHDSFTQAEYDFWIRFARVLAKEFPLPTDKVQTSWVFFCQANYLQDDELYQHLHMLALHDRIESHVLDLTDMEAMAGLVGAVERAGEYFGIIDISNVWNYVCDLMDTVDAFLSRIEDESVILQTCITGMRGFSYHAFTWRYLKQKEHSFLPTYLRKKDGETWGTAFFNEEKVNELSSAMMDEIRTCKARWLDEWR